MTYRQELLESPDEERLTQFEDEQANIWTATPGEVVSVNLDAQTVTVQPAIQANVPHPDGSVVATSLPLLVDVPIVWPRAGGFALTFPIAAGDEVLVVFASRCIDAWWQSGGVQPQAEMRMHDLSDGFAILAPTSQPKKLAAVSSSNVQLRNEAGDTFLEITPDGIIRAKATNKAIIEAPEIDYTASTVMNLKAPQINMVGNLSTTGYDGGAGTISMAGHVQLTGDMHSTADIVAGSISLQSHVHGGVQGGTSNTSGPQ